MIIITFDIDLKKLSKGKPSLPAAEVANPTATLHMITPVGIIGNMDEYEIIEDMLFIHFS